MDKSISMSWARVPVHSHYSALARNVFQHISDYYAGSALELRNKIIIGASVLVVVLVGAFAIQYLLTGRGSPSGTSAVKLDETFTKQDFTYGPQAWMPYSSNLAVVPEGNVSGEIKYYILVVDLYATSNLSVSNPGVKVEYSLKGLQGTAAFHVYGYRKANKCVSWTNRVDGTGSSGLYVNSGSGAASTLPGTTVMPQTNNLYIEVANNNGAKFNDYGNNTYYVKFTSPTGGLNTLHITSDPAEPNGGGNQHTEHVGLFLSHLYRRPSTGQHDTNGGHQRSHIR